MHGFKVCSPADEMNKAVEELTQASHKIAEAMYQTAQQQPGAGEPSADQPADSAQSSSSSEADDTVIDAEFVDTDEDKK